MQEGQGKAAFEWDQYWDDFYEDLAQDSGVTESVYEYDPLPKEHKRPVQVRAAAESGKIAEPAQSGSLRESILQWATPVMVVAGLAVSATLPKMLGFADPPLKSTDLFVALPAVPEPAMDVIPLRTYSDRQQRMFVSGLQQLSDADLISYAATNKADLARADPLMATLLEDAMTLTNIELKRRNLDTPTVPRIIQEVLIPLPE